MGRGAEIVFTQGPRRRETLAEAEGFINGGSELALRMDHLLMGHTDQE